MRTIKRLMDTNGIDDPARRGTATVRAERLNMAQRGEFSPAGETLAQWFNRRFYESTAAGEMQRKPVVGAADQLSEEVASISRDHAVDTSLRAVSMIPRSFCVSAISFANAFGRRFNMASIYSSAVHSFPSSSIIITPPDGAATAPVCIW